MEQKPLTKRKLQAVHTKKKIYKISVELIQEKGYDNVTVDDICNACDISKGAFYHHFHSKLDIISHMETMLNNSISETLIDHYDVSIYEKILILCSSMMDAIEKTGLEFTRQRTKYVVGGECISEDRDGLSIYLRKMMKEMLIEAVNTKELKEETPVNTLSEIIMTLIYGLIADWCIYNGSFSLPEKTWNLTHYLVPDLLRPYLNQ